MLIATCHTIQILVNVWGAFGNVVVWFAYSTKLFNSFSSSKMKIILTDIRLILTATNINFRLLVVKMDGLWISLKFTLVLRNLLIQMILKKDQQQ